MKQQIKSILEATRLMGPLKTAADTAALARGLRSFSKQGKTPKRAHDGLISLFCKTGGLSNDLLHRYVARRRPPVPLEQNGVLGPLDAAKLQKIRSVLDDRGYYVFEQRLSDETCDRLLDFSLRNESTVRVKKPGAPTELVQAKYDRENPIGVRYDFDEPGILKSPDAQKLMADPSLLAVAQAYLGCEPILDLLAFWWHTSFSRQPDKDAAQFFHFDMDRIKWLKFFFYLTDVGPDNGPHTFVAGSHRTGGIPAELLKKGMTRLTDEEVARCYKKDDFIEFSAPRGTIIAEDTRGLHKGKHVHTADRLVFQLEFSDSLFGMEYPDAQGAAVLNPELEAMIKAHPGIYSKYFR